MSSRIYSLLDASHRVLIYRGGTRGIGQAIAVALAKAGANVVLLQVAVYASILFLLKFELRSAEGHLERGHGFKNSCSWRYCVDRLL